MSLKIERVRINEFTSFIKRLLSIDDFIYLKLENDAITSNCYLPERDAVKQQSIQLGEIFELNEMTDKLLKISFLNGKHTINALNQFIGLNISAEIEYKDYQSEYVATNLKLISDELVIDLPCSDPTLGFQDMTTDQIKAVFSTDDSMFNFNLEPFQIDKLVSLFNLEKENETFKVVCGPEGIHFKGKTYSTLVTDTVKQETETETTFYKRYIPLFDKESYEVSICYQKAVLRSQTTDTVLTIASCITE